MSSPNNYQLTDNDNNNDNDKQYVTTVVATTISPLVTTVATVTAGGPRVDVALTTNKNKSSIHEFW